jgi:hypothetical protein
MVHSLQFANVVGPRSVQRTHRAFDTNCFVVDRSRDSLLKSSDQLDPRERAGFHISYRDADRQFPLLIEGHQYSGLDASDTLVRRKGKFTVLLEEFEVIRITKSVFDENRLRAL